MIRTIEREGLDRLLAALHKQGYETIGPRVQSGAIVYDEVRSTKDFPLGWTDQQGPGLYRLTKGEGGELFAFVVGPMSWKKFLFPPELRLMSVSRKNGTIAVTDPLQAAAPKRAIIGVRACELAAIAIQDKVFLEGPYRDPHYAAARANLFVVAVNCTTAAATCFCRSMNTGPAATGGYDLCLTEVPSGGRHLFTVEVGSERGEGVLKGVPFKEATEAEVTQARARVEHAASSITKTLATEGLHDSLKGAIDHPRWEAVANRCVTCGNCTQVCPTCFCSTVEDVTDLSGSAAHRTRKWDSCFTLDFSYIHGGSVRTSAKARYRQWLLHKLANWVDQFQTMGCVGCGRCITWCPVGIDITEEAGALRQAHTVSHPSSGE